MPTGTCPRRIQGTGGLPSQGSCGTAAAALVWIVGKANDLFEQRTGGMQVRDLMSHFGLGQGSISQRAATMLRAGGFRDDT